MWIKDAVNHLKKLKSAKKFGRLALEITVVLIFKTLLLWLIWALFFSHAVPKDARQSAVTRMILNHPEP
ncbi:MAG TPA: hypothetical protein VK974_03320 [Methylophilaceae bacterium]|nr:hypothetical protein [Methylophilaceae bacterium]